MSKIADKINHFFVKGPSFVKLNETTESESLSCFSKYRNLLEENDKQIKENIDSFKEVESETLKDKTFSIKPSDRVFANLKEIFNSSRDVQKGLQRDRRQKLQEFVSEYKGIIKQVKSRDNFILKIIRFVIGWFYKSDYHKLLIRTEKTYRNLKKYANKNKNIDTNLLSKYGVIFKNYDKKVSQDRLNRLNRELDIAPSVEENKLVLRGNIQHSGNNCYIDTALQVCAHIPIFRDAFDSEKNPINEEDLTAKELQELGNKIIQEVLVKRLFHRVPKDKIDNFRKRIFEYEVIKREYGDRFGIDQYDAGELILRLLEKLNRNNLEISCRQKLIIDGESSVKKDATGSEGYYQTGESGHYIQTKEEREESSDALSSFEFSCSGEDIKQFLEEEETEASWNSLADWLVKGKAPSDRLPELTHRSSEDTEGQGYLVLEASGRKESRDLEYPDVLTVTFQERSSTQKIEMPITWKPPGSEDEYQLQSVVKKSGSKNGGHYWALLREDNNHFIKADDMSNSLKRYKVSALKNELSSGYVYYYQKKA